MECLGGNGYVEESALPRLYREAPVNAIWEGSGNVMALDVLRVLRKSSEPLEAVLANVEDDLGGSAQVDARTCSGRQPRWRSPTRARPAS